MAKNAPASAGDTGDVGLVPELGRSSGGGNGNPLPWTEEPGVLEPMGWQRDSPT